MRTFEKQTLLFTEAESIFSQEDSHASRIRLRVKDLVKKTKDISGRNLLEQLERLSPGSSWVKMFMASLIGTGDWCSMKCKLTWRIKATRSHRLYFQLVPSTLHIDEIEFGLLPTPTGMMNDCYADNSPNSHLRHTHSIATLANRGMLPTPQSRDHKNGSKSEDGRTKRKKEQGWSQNLNDLATQKLLPTPNASDNRNRGNPDDPCVQKRIANGKQVGLTMMVDGQLNPRFVAEMMGFPPDWMDLPFQNGEKNK